MIAFAIITIIWSDLPNKHNILCIVNKSLELRNVIYHSVCLSDSTYSHKMYWGNLCYCPYICYEKCFFVWQFSTKTVETDDGKYIISRSEKKKNMFSSKTSWIIHKYWTCVNFTELEKYLSLYSGDLQNNLQSSSPLHITVITTENCLIFQPWNYNLTRFSKTSCAICQQNLFIHPQPTNSSTKLRK